MNSQSVGTQGQISWWVCVTCNMELFNSGIWCIENWREYRSWLTEVHLYNLHLHAFIGCWHYGLESSIENINHMWSHVRIGHNISSHYLIKHLLLSIVCHCVTYNKEVWCHQICTNLCWWIMISIKCGWIFSKIYYDIWHWSFMNFSYLWAMLRLFGLIEDISLVCWHSSYLW